MPVIDILSICHRYIRNKLDGGTPATTVTDRNLVNYKSKARTRHWRSWPLHSLEKRDNKLKQRSIERTEESLSLIEKPISPFSVLMVVIIWYLRSYVWVMVILSGFILECPGRKWILSNFLNSPLVVIQM